MMGNVFGMGMARAIEISRERAKAQSELGEVFRNNSKISHVKEYIRFLEANVAKSLMINETLWELMNEKLGVTSEEFFAKLGEVDMRDGAMDNKNQRTVIECKCGRKNSGRQPCCIYCGELFDKSVFSM
jgi:hypothetical protein